MDTPDERIFLVTGSSVLVTDAIAYAYLRCRPCVVLSGDLPELPDGREQRSSSR
ncbi:hypothetical protein [Rhodococcus spongiicola]|uniref:hypothetical protein n=1 Tax=Rhodococcus spongiicola TaxID=2487352 RepID=UPI0013E315F4|nr:hypothetical protein [Rhodococcus spongiicola]